MLPSHKNQRGRRALSSTVSLTNKKVVHRHDRRDRCGFFFSTVAGSVELLGPVQKCTHNTKEQRECESIDVFQQLHDWAFQVLQMVTALLSSTPAVAERPATSLSTGATRPGGPLNMDFLLSNSPPFELHIHKV